jgi:hypothetical protein
MVFYLIDPDYNTGHARDAIFSFYFEIRAI